MARSKEAEAAYQAAVEEIEAARKDGRTTLDFYTDQFRALDEIPSQIIGLPTLEKLVLKNTQISDLSLLANLSGLKDLRLNQTATRILSPLSGLARLKILQLNSTKVSELSALTELFELQSLFLDMTDVNDLTPLLGLTRLQTLHLVNTKVHDLTPLAGLIELRDLRMDVTDITDLSPLAELTELRSLTIGHTKVRDLHPLTKLKKLQDLYFDNTSVSDLRPLIGLDKLGDGSYRGLWFANTPAVKRDISLEFIEEIENHKQRTRKVLAYLKTLPPWPEPLPWLATEVIGDGTTPPDIPQPEGPPEVEPSDEGIDLAYSPIDAVDLSSPIKKRLYAKLPEAVKVLARHGNHFVEVKGPTDALQGLVSLPFEEADLLDIHLQIMALSDVRDLDATKPAAERLDADCMTALNSFLRLGPPVTMGHPDVDALEKALADYARQHLPSTVPEGERRVANGIATSPDIAGERLRRVAGQVAKAPDQGRVAEYRRSLHRNTILALAYVAGAIGEAATGFVFGEVTVHAAQFLVLHKDAIMATAPAWGETGYRWLEYMLVRAHQIVDEARKG